MVKWFDYIWNNKEFVDDFKNLEYFLEKLCVEICIYVYLKIFR